MTSARFQPAERCRRAAGFLCRQERGHDRGGRHAVDRRPQRVGDRDSRSLRFARNIRGQVDEGARRVAKNTGGCGQRFVYRAVLSGRSDAHAGTRPSPTIHAEGAGVNGLDYPVALDAQIECRRTRSRTPGTSPASICGGVVPGNQNLRRVGQIRLEMRPARNGGIDRLHPAAFAAAAIRCDASIGFDVS